MADKCDLLEIRMDILEKTVQELKTESKEERKQFTQAIEGLNQSLHELKENGIKLNMLLERTDEKLSDLNSKVDGIEQDIKSQPQLEDSNIEFYQTTLGNVLKWVFILLGVLIAFITGANIDQILGFLG